MTRSGWAGLVVGCAEWMEECSLIIIGCAWILSCSLLVGGCAKTGVEYVAVMVGCAMMESSFFTMVGCTDIVGCSVMIGRGSLLEGGRAEIVVRCFLTKVGCAARVVGCSVMMEGSSVLVEECDLSAVVGCVISIMGLTSLLVLRCVEG